jgi:hypothetical protein
MLSHSGLRGDLVIIRMAMISGTSPSGAGAAIAGIMAFAPGGWASEGFRGPGNARSTIADINRTYYGGQQAEAPRQAAGMVHPG